MCQRLSVLLEVAELAEAQQAGRTRGIEMTALKQDLRDAQQRLVRGGSAGSACSYCSVSRNCHSSFNILHVQKTAV